MSRNEIILGVFALVLVGFSLIVSLVVPRRLPDFPRRRLGLFVFVAVLLVVAMLGAVEVFGAEDEEENGEAVAEQPQEGGTGEAPPPGQTGGEGEGDAGAQGDPANGKEIYASAGCGTCHAFEDAGSTGTVGPDLDEAQPSAEAAAEQIASGGGGMPAFEGQLSEQEIADVAAYVSGG